jgi:putative DNA primase/helicase
MRARDIAMYLGGNGTKRGGRYWCNCPVHGGTNQKLSIKDDDRWGDGIDVKCWSLGCDGGAIKAAFRRLGLMSLQPSDRPQVDPKVAEQRAKQERAEQRKKREWARRLWERAEANAAEVARYLSECRAIDLVRIGGMPAALRYAINAVIPETDPKQYGFAMMAAVTDALADLTAIHETFLNFSGTAKAGAENDKYIIGVMGGGAVRLAPMAARLGIAEGIETALSAAELHRVPTWAVLSTSGMTGFMVPPSVRSVVIFADRDERKSNGKRPGTVAAKDLARRLAQQRIECRIQYPALGFADFNDELRARKRQRGAA